MKFFSFLKEDIHPQVGEKIIKKDVFSKIIEVDDILNLAKEDIEKVKEKTNEDCEILKKEAEKEGFEQGLEKLNIHISKLEETINNLNKEYEEKIFKISIMAIKKIIAEELKLQPTQIKKIIEQSLKPVYEHHSVKIYVSRQDYLILEKEKENIKNILRQVKSFSLEPRDDILPGGCIIETEGGIINAQLENQFRAIEAFFEKFTKNI